MANLTAQFRSLDNYKSEQPTRSCFLDGRYIPLVLEDVREFRKRPIKIDIELDAHLTVLSSNITGSSQTIEGMNIFRVVITTPIVAHSALVWVDTRVRTITYSDIRSDDISDDRVAAYLEKVDQVVQTLLREFFGELRYKHLLDVAYVREDVSPDCKRFGFCNAYVIKQVVDYVHNRDFDPTHIQRFATAVERKYAYKLDPNTEPEVEYIIGGLGLGLGLGVLGGLAIGGAAAASQPRYVYAQPPVYGYPAYGYGYPATYGYPAY